MSIFYREAVIVVTLFVCAFTIWNVNTDKQSLSQLLFIPRAEAVQICKATPGCIISITSLPTSFTSLLQVRKTSRLLCSKYSELNVLVTRNEKGLFNVTWCR